MSHIRRQSIISTIVIYVGFAVGLLNTYLFTKQGIFTEDQYGLVQTISQLAIAMMSFSMLGMPSYIYKFFPYYNDRLEPQKNDMLSIALLVTIIGFLLVLLFGNIFKGAFIAFFGKNSPDVVNYYSLAFVVTFGLTLYTVLEAYTWNLRKAVLTNFLREFMWRFLTTILIILFVTGIIKSFDAFLKAFSLAYTGIAGILIGYLIYTKRFYIRLSPSIVTKRFAKKIVALCAFVYSGTVIFTLSGVLDTLFVASLHGTAQAGIFSLAQNMAAVIQAPQRGVISAAIPVLSKAWKDKDYGSINRVYQRSSLNQLIFSLGLFILIWLNFTEAVVTFNLKDSYLTAYYAFVIMGLTRVIDMGTGVNSQIIATSTYWKFEFFCGILLLSLMLPLNYFLTKQYAIAGPALANLISIFVYNTVRVVFLWTKFNMQPFTRATLYTLGIAAVTGVICFWSLQSVHGFLGLLLRSILFVVLYGAAVIYFRLSPDVMPIWAAFKKRIGLK